jgi:hypothetical protein
MIILTPCWRREGGGPMSGAHLGFNCEASRAACAARLRRLGYWTTAYVDTRSRYALMIGAKAAVAA